MLLYQYTKAYDAGVVPQIGTETAVRQDVNITMENGQKDPTTSLTTVTAITPYAYKTKAGLQITIDQAEKHLLVHAKVYACGDRLGIEELKEYACSGFVDLAGDDQMKLYHQQFYGPLLGYIYDNTVLEFTQAQEKAPGSTSLTASGLRHAATMCASQNLNIVVVAESIRNAIQEHEPMAWEMAVALRSKRTELIQSQSAHERTKRSLSIVNGRIGAEEMTYAKKIVRRMETILITKRCDGCNKDLKVGALAVEGSSSRDSAKAVVNCRSCGQRYELDV